MVLIREGLVLPVLDLLKLSVPHHGGVELAVLVDIVLVLDLLLVRKAREVLLVLLLQLCHPGAVAGEGLFLLRLAGGHNLAVVVAVKVLLQVLLRLGDQAVHLGLVLLLDGLCRFQVLSVLGNELCLLVLRVVLVFLYQGDVVCQLHHHIGAVPAKGIDLLLDRRYMLLNRLTELVFFLLREDLLICHCDFPSLTDISRSV